MKSVFIIETDTFIIPLFERFGAFVSGKQSDNLTKKPWLCDPSVNGEKEAGVFWEEEGDVMIGILEVYINPRLSSPFIPLQGSKFLSDGCGNIFPRSLDRRKALEAKKKTINSLFEKRIKILKKLKRGKSHIKMIKAIKKVLYNTKLETTEAFTNLGIIWGGSPDKSDIETIQRRAKVFAEKNNFKILGFRTQAFSQDMIKPLQDAGDSIE